LGDLILAQSLPFSGASVVSNLGWTGLREAFSSRSHLLITGFPGDTDAHSDLRSFLFE
jgi:hypothetical protein